MTAIARPRHKVSLARLVAATYFMVAGGPYGLEDLIARFGYAGALIALSITPLLWSFPTALMVGELSSALPQEGGYYVWCSRALGDFWGFYEAWLSLLASIFDMAIYPTLFALYLGRLFPPWSGPSAAVYAGLALIVGCAAWNLRGARAVGSGSIALLAALSIPFVAMIALALFSTPSAGGSANAGASLTSASKALSTGDADPRAVGGLSVAMWNYMGWDNAATIAGEVERPRRTYPLAMLITLLAVAGSYLIAVAAAERTGMPAASWKTGSWVEAGARLGGPWLARATAVGGMISAAGMFCALTMSYSRLPMIMAHDGFLPSALARPNPRSGAPATAIVICSIAYALCLGLGFERLVDLDVVIYGLSLMLEFAALVALRIREPALMRPFRIPGGLVGLGLATLLPTGILVWAAASAVRETDQPIALALLTFGAIAGGPVLYRLVRRGGDPVRSAELNEIDRAE